MGDEGIDMRGIAFVFSAIEIVVQGADIFAAETLDNQDDDIPCLARNASYAILSDLMDRRIDRLQGFGVLEVVRHLENILSYGADE